VPEPGTGNLFSDPLFFDPVNLDFSLVQNSPCIDTGSPDEFDPDETICDIGALYFPQEISLAGDCNEDGGINVMDIIQIINSCILQIDNIEECLFCGDMNGDNSVDVLDIISLINIIILGG